MFLPLAFALVVRQRKERQRASAIRATIHPSQVIPPPVNKPGDPPGLRGTLSHGGGVPAPPAQLMTLRLPARAAPAPPHWHMTLRLPARAAPHAGPLPLATYLGSLNRWHAQQLVARGAKAADPPRPVGLAVHDRPAAVAAYWHAEYALWLARAMPSRPSPLAQPLDQAAWLRKFKLNPMAGYSEWPWARTGKGHEARTIVPRSGSDWVQWYVQPNGAWSYDHHYGSSFDLGHAIAQATAAFGSALSSAAHEAGHVVQAIEHPFQEALAFATQEMNKTLDTLERALPPQCRPLLEGLKKAEGFLTQVEETALDPSRIDWRAVADYMEAATSTLPILGTAMSDIIATGEALLDMLTSGNVLEAALRALYDYIMGTLPGVAVLEQWIRPVFNVLLDVVVKGQKPTRALITEAVQQAPASPSIGHYSPRSIAASLATFVVGKMGLA